MSYPSGNACCTISRCYPLLLCSSGSACLTNLIAVAENLRSITPRALYTFWMRRCFGATSWQPCFGVRGHRHFYQKARDLHTVTAAVDQPTATTEVPKTNKQQQKKQMGPKSSKVAGGKDKKSELAVTPKSEDFAR